MEVADWFIYFSCKMLFTFKSLAAEKGTKLTRDDTNCPCDRADTHQITEIIMCWMLITCLLSLMSLNCYIMYSDQEKCWQFVELLFIEKLSRLLFRTINSACFSTIISVPNSRTMTNTQGS